MEPFILVRIQVPERTQNCPQSEWTIFLLYCVYLGYITIPMNVTIYSTPTCPYCKKAKEYLTEKGVAFADINVAADRAKAEEMIQKSGQMGVPVLDIGGTIVVGFDKSKIDAALAKAA